MEEEEEGWWKGRVDGKEGLFPSNFVEMLEQNGSSDPVHDYSVPPPLDKREYMGRVGLLDWNVCPTFVYGNVVCEGGCVHVHVCVCISLVPRPSPKAKVGLYVCMSAHICVFTPIIIAGVISPVTIFPVVLIPSSSPSLPSPPHITLSPPKGDEASYVIVPQPRPKPGTRMSSLAATPLCKYTERGLVLLYSSCYLLEQSLPFCHVI